MTKKLVMSLLGMGLLGASGLAMAQDAAPALDSGDTAWMLTSTLLSLIHI